MFTSNRTLLVITAQLGLKVHAMDVDTAFFNAPINLNVNVGGAHRSHYLRGCVCLFGHKTTCVFVLVFLSFWQLNARVFVKNFVDA